VKQDENLRFVLFLAAGGAKKEPKKRPRKGRHLPAHGKKTAPFAPKGSAFGNRKLL
jgi:hypothetical protein